jgi:hypothetical protein
LWVFFLHFILFLS